MVVTIFDSACYAADPFLKTNSSAVSFGGLHCGVNMCATQINDVTTNSHGFVHHASYVIHHPSSKCTDLPNTELRPCVKIDFVHGLWLHQSEVTNSRLARRLSAGLQELLK